MKAGQAPTPSDSMPSPTPKINVSPPAPRPESGGARPRTLEMAASAPLVGERLRAAIVQRYEQLRTDNGESDDAGSWKLEGAISPNLVADTERHTVLLHFPGEDVAVAIPSLARRLVHVRLTSYFESDANANTELRSLRLESLATVPVTTLNAYANEPHSIPPHAIKRGVLRRT